MTTFFHNTFLYQLFEFLLEGTLVRMRNCASTRTERRNRQINFKMIFLICESLQLVVEKNIKIGKELKEILMLLWCEMGAQICNYLHVSSFIQTIQCFCSEVIVKESPALSFSLLQSR